MPRCLTGLVFKTTKGLTLSLISPRDTFVAYGIHSIEYCKFLRSMIHQVIQDQLSVCNPLFIDLKQNRLQDGITVLGGGALIIALELLQEAALTGIP